MNALIRFIRVPALALAVLALAAGSALGRSGVADLAIPSFVAERLAPHQQPLQPVDEDGDEEAELNEEAELTAESTDPGRHVELLEEAGIETTDEDFAAVADELGMGGAVRAFAWADALADAEVEGAPTVEEIAEMFAETPGWGRLAKELDPDGEYGLHPGIGWIMRGADEDDDDDVEELVEESGAVITDEGDDDGDAEDATATGRPDNPGQQGRDKAAQARGNAGQGQGKAHGKNKP
jgi:hypothetical protein